MLNLRVIIGENLQQRWTPDKLCRKNFVRLLKFSFLRSKVQLEQRSIRPAQSQQMTIAKIKKSLQESQITDTYWGFTVSTLSETLSEQIHAQHNAIDKSWKFISLTNCSDNNSCWYMESNAVCIDEILFLWLQHPLSLDRPYPAFVCYIVTLVLNTFLAASHFIHFTSVLIFSLNHYGSLRSDVSNEFMIKNRFENSFLTMQPNACLVLFAG